MTHVPTITIEMLDGVRHFMARCSCGWCAGRLEPVLLDAYRAQEHHQVGTELPGSEDLDFPGCVW